MTNLETHAERELRKAGFFDNDGAYSGMLGPAVLRMVKVFADENHSGMSAQIALNLFNRVARFKVLTAITSDPSEWRELEPDMRPKTDERCWQNLRQSSCFSTDGGKTYYDLDEPHGQNVHKAADSTPLTTPT